MSNGLFKYDISQSLTFDDKRGEVFAPLPDIFLGTALEAHIMFVGMTLEFV
jgi:hypothetical protein